MFRYAPSHPRAARRLLLSPWRIALLALPYRWLPKPDWGFYPGLRALLRYAWLSLRFAFPPRARLHYWLLSALSFRRTQRHHSR